MKPRKNPYYPTPHNSQVGLVRIKYYDDDDRAPLSTSVGRSSSSCSIRHCFAFKKYKKDAIMVPI